MSSRIARKPAAADTAAERPSIETLRARMDEINLKILRLVSLRAGLAMEIGRLKHHHGEVYQPVRERAIIEKMIAENQGPLTDEQVKRIYVEIISACRALEHEPRVAFLGPEHTYSHEATRMRFGSSVELMPLESFAAVFQAIENGRADFGVVPVENSTEGSVTLTLDLLIDTALVIIGEILLPIRHSIMSLSGAAGEVRRIVSHQQSLAQCRGYLSAKFPELRDRSGRVQCAGCKARRGGFVAGGDRVGGGGRGVWAQDDRVERAGRRDQHDAIPRDGDAAGGAVGVGTGGQDDAAVRGRGSSGHVEPGAEPVCAQRDQYIEDRIASAAGAAVGVPVLC